MTSSGRRSAALLGIAIVLALPKQVPCEVPGRAPGVACEVLDADGRPCRKVDVEPLGVYAIEWVTGSDLPIAYSQRLDC